MSIDEFKLLSDTERDEFVLDHGLFLINYLQGDIMCDVYRVNNFYVKFSYSISQDESPSIIAFTDGEHLRLFIDQLPNASRAYSTNTI